MANPKVSPTIEEFITDGQSIPLTYNNLSFLEKISEQIYAPIFNVIDDYIDDLKLLAIDITLSDTEFLKYQYRPKLLANDVYKNGELYFVIMALNGICDVKEFTKKKIKLLNINQMKQAMEYIYNAEKSMIDNYNER